VLPGKEIAGCIFVPWNFLSSSLIAAISGIAGSDGGSWLSESTSVLSTVISTGPGSCGRWNGPALRGLGRVPDFPECGEGLQVPQAPRGLAMPAAAVAGRRGSDVRGRGTVSDGPNKGSPTGLQRYGQHKSKTTWTISLDVEYIPDIWQHELCVRKQSRLGRVCDKFNGPPTVHIYKKQ